MSEFEDTSFKSGAPTLAERAYQRAAMCGKGRGHETGSGMLADPDPVKRRILGRDGRRPAWLGRSDQPRVKAPARSQEKSGAPRGRIILLPTEVRTVPVRSSTWPFPAPVELFKVSGTSTILLPSPPSLLSPSALSLLQNVASHALDPYNSVSC